jgi:hypothetical protein
VVAVDREDREADVVVRRLKVDATGGKVGALVGEDAEGDWAVAEACRREDLHRAHDGPAGRLVVVEEVAAEEDEVCALGRRELENLGKGREGVVLSDVVLLPDALRRVEGRGGG